MVVSRQSHTLYEAVSNVTQHNATHNVLAGTDRELTITAFLRTDASVTSVVVDPGGADEKTATFEVGVTTAGTAEVNLRLYWVTLPDAFPSGNTTVRLTLATAKDDVQISIEQSSGVDATDAIIATATMNGANQQPSVTLSMTNTDAVALGYAQMRDKALGPWTADSGYTEEADFTNPNSTTGSIGTVGSRDVDATGNDTYAPQSTGAADDVVAILCELRPAAVVATDPGLLNYNAPGNQFMPHVVQNVPF